jgi:hypothetical protein
MKKLLFISTIALAFAACHNAGNNANTTNKADSAIGIGKMSNFSCPGDSLNLTNTVISPVTASTYTASAQNYIKISNNPVSGGSQTLPLPNQTPVVFSFADSLNKVARLLPPPGGTYFSAVAMFFGIYAPGSGQYTSEVFFKPIVISGTLNVNVGTFPCPTFDTNNFYTVSPLGAVSKVTYSKFTTDTSSFRQFTWYLPCPSCSGGNQWQPFNSASNSNGSIRYLIYPMQEIAALCKNRNDTVFIEYACHNYDASDSMKLDLILHSNTVALATNTNNDLAHLVPPATSMTYSVITKNNNK